MSELTVSVDAIERARALPMDGADRAAAVNAQRRTIEFLERYPRAAAALQRLKARGLLEVTPLGVVLREGTSAHDAELAYAAYLSSDPNGDVHFEFDGRRRLVPSPSTNDAVLALRRDGVARIRDWGVSRIASHVRRRGPSKARGRRSLPRRTGAWRRRAMPINASSASFVLYSTSRRAIWEKRSSRATRSCASTQQQRTTRRATWPGCGIMIESGTG